MISEKIAKRILQDYKEAWINQDINKILQIFTKDGIYTEKAFEQPFKGHKEIANYWKEKVCEEQFNIKFKLLNYYICDQILIAEWFASFNSKVKGAKQIKEVAIMELKGDKIKSLREYWQSK